MNQATVDMLRGMRMTAMAIEMERQMTDPAYRALSAEETDEQDQPPDERCSLLCP